MRVDKLPKRYWHEAADIRPSDAVKVYLAITNALRDDARARLIKSLGG